MATDIEFHSFNATCDLVVIYDVRNPEEIEATGHIPGARNWPMNEMEDGLKMDDESFLEKYEFKKPQMGENLVTYCQMGGRARRAGDLLAANGFTVRVYAGSFNDWKAKGGEIIPGKPVPSSNPTEDDDHS